MERLIVGAMIVARSPCDDWRDLSVAHLAELARTHRILILRGFRPLDREDVDAYRRRWSGHPDISLRCDGRDLIIEART